MFRVARVTHQNALTRTSYATEFRTARTAPTRRMLAVSSKLTLFYFYPCIEYRYTRYCLAGKIF